MQSKQKRKFQLGEEPVESKPGSSEPIKITKEAKDAAKNAWDQMLGGSGKSVLEQMLGKSSNENRLIEGQEFILPSKKTHEKTRESKPQITEEFVEYKRSVINAERPAEAKTEMEIKRAVEQIQAEIKRLSQTSKLVERTAKDATAEKAPVKPGRYHLSFFEFVLGVLRDATRKLEDTVHFGAVFTSKKQQSKYWNAYKKHGTQFGLSGERTVSTQTG
jgi:hypothetical protein